MKFRKDLFYSPDQWLCKDRSELLEDGETRWLCHQARNARIALEKRLEEVMNEQEDE